MHCLIVTILCCVDDHFTSFVVVDWFAVNFVASYVQYLGKTACHVYQIGYQYRLFSVINIGYQKNIKIDIGTPLTTNRA